MIETMVFQQERKKKGNTVFDLSTAPCGFSKLLGKLVVKYVSTYTKGTLKNKDQQRPI